MTEQIGFIEKVRSIYEKLDVIVQGSEIFDENVIETLNRLEQQDLAVIIEDLRKGNYLGNRKIDINLALNNSSTIDVATYQKIDITLVDGTKLEMPFDNGSGGVLELSSHADIKNFMVNHPLYVSNIVDTEVVMYEAFGEIPNMIRVRDADGKASNIERIELYAYSGAVVNTKVSYFWAKTTSALETLANRVGDIIQLGNDVDSIVVLSQRIDELISLQGEISKLITIFDNLSSIIINANNIDAINNNSLNKDVLIAINNKLIQLTSIHENLTGILASQNHSQVATEKAQVATEKAQVATEKAQIAQNHAAIAKEQADLATEKVLTIQGISVQGQTLQPGQPVTVSYNPISNKFTFSIPQGAKGDRGDAFKVNAIGTLTGRSLFDAEQEGFSYLATDVLVEDSVIPHIYFKVSNLSGQWTTGIPFGRGEKGSKGDTGVGIQNITRTSGDGSQGTTDTYTIALSDGSTHEFIVWNGRDSDISSSDLNALENMLNESIDANTTSINNHKNNEANPHKVTKEQIGLSNVENISPEDLPLSIAANEALALKADKTEVYTKTILDLKISTQQFDKPSGGPLFIKVSPSSIKIPAGLKLTVGAESFKVVTDYSLSLASDLLVPETKTAGTDYYVYAKANGTFYISSNKNITTDRLIGGFHYSLVGESETATGNKTEADMVKIRGINAYSFWDLKYRPVANSEGMVCIGKKWYDIYLLNSEHIANGTSKAGLLIAGGSTTSGRAIPKIPLEYGGNGTLTYGKFTWFQACEIGKAHGKELIPYSEFPTIAYGVLEGASSSTNGYETVAGRIEHYPYLTSKYGIEQAVGTQWIWGSDLANGYGTTDWAWKDNADGRGQIYSTSNSPTAVVLGGGRDDGVVAGSRASFWNNYAWNSFWSVGCRFACDHLELE